MRKASQMIFLFFGMLAGCGNETHDFRGKYVALRGDACAPDAEPQTGDAAVIEIFSMGAGKPNTYQARFPMAASYGFPMQSNPAVPDEKDELHFLFIKQGKPGLFFGEASVEMTVTLSPHKEKPSHLWLTRWEAVVGRNGVVKSMDFLQEASKQFGLLGTKGLCLGKAG